MFIMFLIIITIRIGQNKCTQIQEMLFFLVVFLFFFLRAQLFNGFIIIFAAEFVMILT